MKSVGRTRKRLLGAAVVAVVTMAATVGVAHAQDPSYDFQPTGMWKFTPGASTPYVLKRAPYVGKGGATNVHAAVKEYQRLLGVTPDGIYGPSTARSVAAFQNREAPTAFALGLDLGQRGDINANTAYLLVRPIINAAASSAGIPAGMLSCHAMLEGGFNLGAVQKNPGEGLGIYDLGPVQFSVSHNANVPIARMFDPAFSYNALAQADAAALKRFNGNELAAVYAWNAPTNAAVVARGGAPTEAGKRYMAWMQTCLTTVYAR